VENAFLNNADRDVEAVKDTAVERMLNDLRFKGGERKELEIIDDLAIGATSRGRQPHGGLKPTAAKASRARRSRPARRKR
jgi:hypothetical protein